MKYLEDLNYLEDKQFPSTRYRHCVKVAERMYEYSKDELGYSEGKAQDMYVLGYLHDLGYAFDGEAFGHEIALYNCMKDSYRYADEIRDHSFMIEEKDSQECNLLHYADLTIDGVGNECNFVNRLKDLANRHGENAPNVLLTKDIIEVLIEKDYKAFFEVNQNKTNLTEEDFPMDVFKNSYSIGMKMYAYAKEELGYDESQAREMFILDNLSRIDELFGDKSIIDNLNNSYTYTEDLKNFKEGNYDSEISKLLLFAKNTVDKEGNWCSFNEKLDYVDDYEYQQIFKECDFLENEGFNDSFGLDNSFEL